jgi:hypothetical protein
MCAGISKDLHVGSVHAAANRQIGQLRAIAFKCCRFNRSAYIQRFARIRVADSDTPGGRLNRKRRLRKAPARQRKHEPGNRSNDKPAATSVVVVTKHGCYLLMFVEWLRELFSAYHCQNRLRVRNYSRRLLFSPVDGSAGSKSPAHIVGNRR